MQINKVGIIQYSPTKQNFKGNSATPNGQHNPIPSTPSYQPIDSKASKAYVSPQITEGYREIETVEIPYIGKGKLYELSNGHKVVLIPKIAPTTIYTSVNVGNLNEPANTKETSHLLEHLVGNYAFKPNKEAKEILGKTGAETNALTSNTDTSYYIKAPINNSEDLEQLIKVQYKTLANKNFTQEDIEKEKDIIIQELSSKERFTENILYADRLSLQNLFNLKDSDPIIAPYSIETIKNIKREDLINYYNTFYQPKNMITTIIGNVDENSIKAVAKHLGKLNAQPSVLKDTDYPTLNLNNPIQKTIRKDQQSLNKNEEETYVALSFIGPKNDDEKDMIRSYALREVFRERLSEYSFNNNTGLDFEITSETLSRKKGVPDMIEIFGSDDEEKTEENLKILYQIVYDLAQTPVSKEELNLIKNRMKDNAASASENSLLTASINSETIALSKSLNKAKEIEIINAITAEDIQNTAEKYLDLNKASLVVIHGQKKPKASPFDKVKTGNRPTFTGNINQLSTENVREYLLPNNLRVVIDSRPGIAKSTIKFDLHSQKTLYNNPEANALLAYMLTNDNTKHQLEKQGVYFDADGNSQELFSTSSANADKTLEMLNYTTNTLLNPELDANKFNALKEILSSLPEEEHTQIASDRIDDEWMKGNPLAYKNGSIKDLEFNDLISAHQQILENAQGTIFITVPQEKLKEIQPQIFQTLLGIPTLKAHDYGAIFKKYKHIPLEKTKVFTEEKDTNQIRVKKVFKIIESGNIKDRAGLLILNNVLGGDSESKLFQSLRNNDRIAYSADSRFQYEESCGNLAKITLSTKVSSDNKNNLKTVITEYDKSIQELISNPISKEELDYSKAKLKSSILEELETSRSRNTLVSETYNSFYGIDYQNALIDAIDKMTPEYVQALAKHYFTQPYLLSVVANKDVIEANKNDLIKLGEVIECK